MPKVKVTQDVDKIPRKHGRTAHWSEKQKMEAVSMYRIVGNLRIVGDSLGIPHDTIRKWHIQDWWRDMEIELSKESQIRTKSRLTKIAEKALALVEDRLDNGDWHVNKDGDIVRRPLGALTANKLATDAITQDLNIKKYEKEERAVVSEEKLVDRLQQLHETFAELARKGRQTARGEVFEGELVPPHMVPEKIAQEG